MDVALVVATFTGSGAASTFLLGLSMNKVMSTAYPLIINPETNKL